MSEHNFVVLVVDYYATGEGITRAVVIAPTAPQARIRLLNTVGDYYAKFAEEFTFETMPALMMAQMVPPMILEMAFRTPGFSYSSHYHYNLS